MISVSPQVLIWAQPLFLWDFSAPCRVDVTGDGAGGTCRFVPSVSAALTTNAIQLVPADAWDSFGGKNLGYFVWYIN